jgi:UDPglucose 6-dehydrogenase
VLSEKIKHYFNGNLTGKRFALWGLAFKPNTDDIRDAPSCVLIESLIAAGACIQAYDPEAMDPIKTKYQNETSLALCESAEAALENADALIVVTEWMAFRSPNFESIKEKLAQPVIFDGRNLYNPALLKSHGIDYLAIGRSNL